MAKTTAPMLSFDASGQIGKTQVYSKWKGRGYARRYVIPANPRSAGQYLARTTFALLNSYLKFAGTLTQAPWTAYAKGKVLTDRNANIKFNSKQLQSDQTNAALIMSPGANGGVAASSIATADAGGQAATVTLGVPTVPDGWTITDSVAVLVPHAEYVAANHDWEDGSDNPASMLTYEGNTGDATGIVTVDAVAGDFVVCGWFVMTKSDGSTAYGESLVGSVTLA